MNLTRIKFAIMGAATAAVCLVTLAAPASGTTGPKGTATEQLFEQPVPALVDTLWNRAST